jgi:hypothetical protein
VVEPHDLDVYLRTKGRELEWRNCSGMKNLLQSPPMSKQYFVVLFLVAEKVELTWYVQRQVPIRRESLRDGRSIRTAVKPLHSSELSIQKNLTK